MPQNFLSCDRDQPMLLPPDLRDWLSDDHLAWFVIDPVTELDLGAHIRGFITDREIPSIEEACELEDSPWLAVKPGEHERLAPRPKLSREQYQRSDTGRVDEATVLEDEDNLALRALH
jgi:hypothetical protein